jgi:MraZ protein
MAVFSGTRTAALRSGGDARVSERGLFRGRGLQAIDGKGRLAIPASLRAVIERNSDERTIVIDRHVTVPCLVGYDRDWAALLHDRIERDQERTLLAGGTVDRDADFRNAFATAEDMPFDTSGRFILPAFHRAKARLGELAMFIGLGNTFEIWDPATLIAAPGIADDLKDMVRFDLDARGVVL